MAPLLANASTVQYTNKLIVVHIRIEGYSGTPHQRVQVYVSFSMIHHDIQVWKRNLCGAFYTKWFYQQGTLWRKNNLPNFPPAPKKTQVEGWQPEVEAEFQTNVGNPPATIPMLMQTLRKARPWHFSIGLGFGVQTLGLDWWWDMIYTVYIYMIYIYI